jgi:hypothetical protein
MNRRLFEDRLSRCQLPQALRDRAYRGRNLWAKAGKLPVDERLRELGDLYWHATPKQRQLIRDSVAERDTWNLVVFVRRVALVLQSADDVGWLWDALAVALIEGGSSDYRDLIVSLVLLRFGAERAGIGPRPHFNKALSIATPAMTGILKNARDHSPRDVRITVGAFGPASWK